MAGMYGCFKGRNSDSAAMASGTPDVMTSQEPAEVQEECSGKKKSKFQTFKKFFARKKRKDPSAAGADAGLKASQSSDNVSKASETLTRAEKDKGSGSKISLGGKALSHDSVFVSDSSEANEALGASQDSIHGKVKSLQLQLKQAIKLGSPPSLMCVKRTEDAGTMSEDDGLPCSPPEYTTLHTALNQVQGNSSISLEGIDSDEDQLSCAASSRAVSPLVVPGDFSQPASPFVCLSNSAAKHKLALRQKAKRRPASRPEGKAGSDSVVEELLATSIPEAETAQQQDLQKAEDATDDLLKPKVESEEEEEEEVEEESEEEEQPQHSKQSPLGEKEEREEGEDESEAEQDVSQGPDTSCPPEPSHSEEEDSDTQPLPSSKLSSSTSSLDSPRVTPEPPAGLTDISIASGAEENKDVSHSASEGEEGGVQDHREEENSFLQEVLSSLKGPLMSSSLDMKTEGVILEMKEDEAEEKEKEEAEMEEGEEMEEEEDESLSSQATPSCSMLSDQTTKEREQVVTSFWQEEGGGEVAAKEEIKGGGEEETEDDVEEDEEDPVVERFIQSDDEEEADEQAVEVKTEEESNVLSSQTISQAGDSVEEEDEESDGEEEAIELEKKPDVEEVGWEKREEDEEVEVEVEATERTGVEEAEEAMEGEDDGAEEMPEMLPDTQDEEVQAPVQEADEGVVLEDDSVHTVKHTNDDQIPTEMADQVLTTEQEHFNQNSGDETEEGEEIIEEGVNLNIVEQKSDQEEGVEASQSDADQSEQELEQESVEVTPHSDTKQVERDPSEATEQDDVSSKPPPLSLPPHEPQSQEGEASTPSKTSTTTIHINLVSPSSEKATSLFQLPPAAADPSQSATEAPSYDIESTSIDKEEADAVGEEKQSIQDKEAPVSVEEKVNQPPCSTDQSKVRFTIAPAWQRSQSLNPPPSPPASVSSSTAVAPPCGEELETATEDSVMKAEPVTSPKVELVLSPSRVRNAGSSTAKPQSGVTPAPVTPKISTSASTEESSVTAEGNPDNPFGVRLRKTSALLRFSSEEENTEPPVESQTQPTSSKDDSPQPVSVKPSICPPVSNKPALPKKPEVHGDSGGKLKHVSDPAAGRGVSAGSVPPSWISVAKQKQKIYKENSLEEITVKKEEQERKSSLPAYVSSAASKEQGTKTAESKVSHLEMTKPSVSPDKEAKRPFSPPTPVPPQPLKSHPLPCPISPKPYVPPPQAKYPPQPQPLQRSLSTPDTPKSPVTPPSPSKTPLPVACSPFSRTTSEKPSLRAPGVSGQTASSQRNLPPPALAQDEPPWMALAKKKAKAWSEMPQIVQ